MTACRFFPALVGALLVALIASADQAGDGGAAANLSWRLVNNLPENRFQAELAIANEAEAPLANDWALSFNSSTRILPQSVSAGFEMEHVNGDLYVIRPAADSQPIAPGERRVVRWEGEGWSIDVSDAPSGCYLVHQQETGPARAYVVPLHVEPMRANLHIMRGIADMVPVVSAESRFHQNEGLELLSKEALTKVVPTPTHVAALPGQVTVGAATRIVYRPSLESEAAFLAASLEPLLGTRLTTSNNSTASSAASNTIRLELSEELMMDGSVKREGDEAYRLTMEPNAGITIVGTDSAGVFYGVQTLLALMPLEAYHKPSGEVTIDAVRIEDAPRFRYRGEHLDVARNFQSKESVKKLLDLMAFYKLNRFHLHLTDDEGWRVEIRALPELTDVGSRRGHTLDEADRLQPSLGSGPFADPQTSAGTGFYTQDELIEILRYAHERHIVVIPELDFPGHARAAIKAMEARSRRLTAQNRPAAAEEFLLREPGDKSRYQSVQLWSDNVVDAGREATYRFLDVVVDELVDIFDRAGVELEVVHVGGDEVPEGVWEKSPACAEIELDAKSSISRRGQLELYFLRRARDILARHGIRTACWEDCVLLSLESDGKSATSNLIGGELPLLVYVWNNVWGWGREDAAYRLANAGFDVVLCNATHLYFDLAYEKHPEEPGYYWAGFVSSRMPFELIPLDVFKNVRQNLMGQPVEEASLAGKTRLTKQGKLHIVGIQGQLWGENLRSQQRLEYMAFPRIVALAERAWARAPNWSELEHLQQRDDQVADAWNEFANRLGQRELPRLDWMSGGVAYRIPPPGAAVRDGKLQANVEFPGLEIRYTKDGTEPTAASPLYRGPLSATGVVKLRTFDTRGRGSRTVSVNVPPAEE